MLRSQWDAAGFVFDCDLNETLIDPIAEYDHDEGTAIVGGFVYRGSRIPALRGRYVFGDYTDFFPPTGRLFLLNKKNVVKDDGLIKASRIKEVRLGGREALGLFVLGFGQDAEGELYILANRTGVPFGDTGVVLRIAPRITRTTSVSFAPSPPTFASGSPAALESDGGA